METYLIVHPLGYFASAPNGTKDAAILSAIVSRYGDYLFYKLNVVSDYSISNAIIDAIPEVTQASISNVISTLEGISSDNAEGLLKFLTEQRSELRVVLGEAAPHSTPNPQHGQKLAVIDRIAALQKQLQHISRNHQTELDTLQLQIQTDWEAANRELTSLKVVVCLNHSNGSSASTQTASGGQQ